jgi:hypothetical protein
MDDEKLFKKLQDLEALFAGATTPGERAAAGNARERILARLHTLEQQAPAVEYKFTMQDVWSKKLFLALLRRYDLKPFRYRGQRRTTVMVRVPQRFVDETLWPHFQRASQELRQHLDEVASKVIEQALDSEDADADAEEREQTQQALPFAAEKG